VFWPLNLLLAQETGRSTFRQQSELFLKNWICAGNMANYTQRGRSYNPWSGERAGSAWPSLVWVAGRARLRAAILERGRRPVPLHLLHPTRCIHPPCLAPSIPGLHRQRRRHVAHVRRPGGGGVCPAGAGVPLLGAVPGAVRAGRRGTLPDGGLWTQPAAPHAGPRSRLPGTARGEGSWGKPGPGRPTPLQSSPACRLAAACVRASLSPPCIRRCATA
jgi:hypothetical protein